MEHWCIGQNASADYFNGLMSYFAFVDGTAYDPKLFWRNGFFKWNLEIKTGPSVTYGTNGFF